MSVWQHPGASFPKDEQPTVCPGYSTKLPLVIEGARARFYCNKNDLASFCDGEPTELIRHVIEIQENANGECQSWAMQNPVKS